MRVIEKYVLAVHKYGLAAKAYIQIVLEAWCMIKINVHA